MEAQNAGRRTRGARLDSNSRIMFEDPHELGPSLGIRFDRENSGRGLGREHRSSPRSGVCADIYDKGVCQLDTRWQKVESCQLGRVEPLEAVGSPATFLAESMRVSKVEEQRGQECPTPRGIERAPLRHTPHYVSEVVSPLLEAGFDASTPWTFA
jgi:hypothetical protein